MKRSPIRRVSKKRRAENRVRKANGIATYGENPRCVFPDCTAPADNLHELKTRSRGGSITDMDNCVPLCNPHNSLIGSEYGPAYGMGLLKHSWDGGDAA